MTTDTLLAQEADVKQEAGSSSVSNQEDVNLSEESSASQNEDGNNVSDSSSGEGVKKYEPETLEEMINKSLDEMAKVQAKVPPTKDNDDNQEKPDGESQDSTENTGQEEPEEEAKEPEGDDESTEEKNAPDEWRNNPATKKVIAARKRARAERDEYKAKAEQFETEAGQYRKIREYLDEGGVSDKDAAQALQLVRLWYEDPVAMFSQLERMYGELGTKIGAFLPGDLQREVDEGMISPERAQQLARAQGDVTIARERTDVANKRSDALAKQQETEFRVQLFDKWAGQVAKTDPDLEKKLPFIAARMGQYLATEGDPGSPQAAWDRLTKAYQEVNAGLKGFAPTKKPTPRVPQSSGAQVTQAVAPRTYEEAMAQATDRALGGQNR